MVNFVVDKQETIVRFVELHNVYWCVLCVVTFQVKFKLLVYVLSVNSGRYIFSALFKTRFAHLRYLIPLSDLTL